MLSSSKGLGLPDFIGTTGVRVPLGARNEKLLKKSSFSVLIMDNHDQALGALVNEIDPEASGSI